MNKRLTWLRDCGDGKWTEKQEGLSESGTLDIVEQVFAMTKPKVQCGGWVARHGAVLMGWGMEG
jgi:hypothetical protein